MRTQLSTDKVQLFAYFIFISLTGSAVLSLPFAYKSGIPVPYIDALFTAMSAVCVTGLSSVSMDVYTSAGFIVIMILIELGGLGIISFVSFYLIAPKRKMSLVNRSVVKDFFIEDVEIEPRRILRSIVVLTLTLQFFGASILYFGFLFAGSTRPFLDSVFHSVSAFCNAGFSTYTDSLIRYSSNVVIGATISILIVAGGLGFLVINDIGKVIFKKRHRMSYHTSVVLIVTAFLIVISAIFYFIFEYNGAFAKMDLKSKVLSSFFQAITPRTAGFELVPQRSLSPISGLFTLVLMFIGGSPGSVAGGVKTTTFLIVVLYALRGNYESNGFNMHHRNIGTGIIEKSFSIVAKSILIILGSLTLLLFTEKAHVLNGSVQFFDLLFETVSAFSTVGLSQGITENFSSAGKLILILTMFIGRTGIFAMALGYARYEKERYFEYPSASIMIG